MCIWAVFKTFRLPVSMPVTSTCLSDPIYEDTIIHAQPHEQYVSLMARSASNPTCFSSYMQIRIRPPPVQREVAMDSLSDNRFFYDMPDVLTIVIIHGGPQSDCDHANLCIWADLKTFRLPRTCLLCLQVFDSSFMKTQSFALDHIYICVPDILSCFFSKLHANQGLPYSGLEGGCNGQNLNGLYQLTLLQVMISSKRKVS